MTEHTHEHEQVEAPKPRTVFQVPAENIDSLQGRVEKLNRRVRMLIKRGFQGVSEVTIEVGKPYAVPQKCRAPSCHEGKILGHVCTDCGGTGRAPDRIYHEVTLVSPKPPKVEGWEFIAALTHVDGVGTVLRVCPGAQVEEGELARFRTASSENCDHCHAKRRRTDTFIIRKVR